MFVAAVLTLVVIAGSLMYLVEGAANGFTSIPRKVYRASVTLTTVGYGDIAPQTNVGQAPAAVPRAGFPTRTPTHGTASGVAPGWRTR